MTPERFGKYEIIAKIGQGAMGEVYKAIDRVLGREVAVKTMSQSIGTDPELRRRFHREAQSAGRLNHPNIITVYEFGEEQGQVFMAMELLEGHDLKEVIAAGPRLSLEEKLSLMSQIAEALAFAHAKGVVHRDIKPANIHVQPGGQVKVMDFGLARIAASDMTRAGSLMGTPNYMSPEQVRGETATTRSDVFSLGALFYEILTERKAFQAESLHAVMFQAMHEQPPPIETLRPEVPEPVRRLVEKALSKAPGDRFSDGADLRDALRVVRQAIGPSSGASLPAPPAGPAGAGSTSTASVGAVMPSAGNLALAGSQPASPGPATLAASAPTVLPREQRAAAAGQSGTPVPREGVARAGHVQPPKERSLPALAIGAGLFAIAGAIVVAGLAVGWLWRGRDAASQQGTPVPARVAPAESQPAVSEPAPSSPAATAPTPVPQPLSPPPAASTPAFRSTAVHVREGRRRLEERDLRGARASAQAALAAVPDDSASRRLLDEVDAALEAGEAEARRARIALEAGDAAQAASAIQRLGQLDPRHPQLGPLGIQLTSLLERQAREKPPSATASSTGAVASGSGTAPALPAAGSTTSAAAAARTEPAPASPAAVELSAAQKESARQAIRSALEGYRSAFERRNADALRASYPSVDYDHYKGIFASVQSYEVTLQVQEVTLEADGGAAVCLVTYSPKPKPAGRVGPTRQRFQMRRSGQVWIIDGIATLTR
jgi:eukaryotic-like serine/threonine-protein kinase